MTIQILAMTTLSKNLTITPTDDVKQISEAFEPIARAFCLQLQQQKMVGKKLKVGVKDGDEWKGVEIDFIVWQYDKLTSQVDGNIAVVIDWSAVDAIHLSVSDIVPREEIPILGNPDLVTK